MHPHLSDLESGTSLASNASQLQRVKYVKSMWNQCMFERPTISQLHTNVKRDTAMHECINCQQGLLLPSAVMPSALWLTLSAVSVRMVLPPQFCIRVRGMTSSAVATARYGHCWMPVIVLAFSVRAYRTIQHTIIFSSNPDWLYVLW